jgi:hypothetical protein
MGGHEYSDTSPFSIPWTILLTDGELPNSFEWGSYIGEELDTGKPLQASHGAFLQIEIIQIIGLV